jgi:hypothetical protein
VKNNWEVFKENYYKPINNLKSKLVITLYGSYYPKKDKSLLRELKRILIKKGYSNTCLVEDRQSLGDTALTISQMCMLYSQINLLIFTRSGKRLGLVDELSFLTTDPRMVQKIDFSLVFDQVYQQRSSIPDLSMDRVKRYSVQRREFKSSTRLKEIIVKEIAWLIVRWVDRFGENVVQ